MEPKKPQTLERRRLVVQRYIFLRKDMRMPPGQAMDIVAEQFKLRFRTVYQFVVEAKKFE